MQTSQRSHRLLKLVVLIAMVSAPPTALSAKSSEYEAHSARKQVEAVLSKLDQTRLPADELADLYLDDAVILQPGEPEVQGRDAIMELMEAQAAGPELAMRHRIDDYTQFDDLIVVQGGVTGEARPSDGSGPFAFATKNVILFRQDELGTWRIWKVIFNSAPADD